LLLLGGMAHKVDCQCSGSTFDRSRVGTELELADIASVWHKVAQFTGFQVAYGGKTRASEAWRVSCKPIDKIIPSILPRTPETRILRLPCASDGWI
jgi:hypothetical protein